MAGKTLKKRSQTNNDTDMLTRILNAIQYNNERVDDLMHTVQ
jgi:hypothetical protein